MPSRDSTAEKHSHNCSNIEALSLTTAVGTRRENIKTVQAPFWHYVMPSRDSTVVKHSPHRSNIEALSLTTAVNTRREIITAAKEPFWQKLWPAEKAWW
jgi:hypothetical protein